MKKSKFKKLKVGDTVAVRTLEELKQLKHVVVEGAEQGGDILVKDSKTMDYYFITESRLDEYMSRFCGNVYKILDRYESTVVLGDKRENWEFTRKMLRNEVTK